MSTACYDPELLSKHKGNQSALRPGACRGKPGALLGKVGPSTAVARRERAGPVRSALQGGVGKPFKELQVLGTQAKHPG